MPVVYLFATGCIIAVMLTLGLQPGFMKRLTGVLLIIVTILGIAAYGYGFYYVYQNIPTAVIRTVYSVAIMFTGKNEIKDISSVPLYEKPGMLFLLYVVHFAALYCTASAVMQTIGIRLIRLLRLLFMRRGKLNIIFGVNEDSINFAKEMTSKENGMVVFVPSDNTVSFDSAILRMGGILLNDSSAKNPNLSFLHRIGLKPGKRKMSLYCLDRDASKNLCYAKSMLNALEERGIMPDQTELIAYLPSESEGEALQMSGQEEQRVKGFGRVHAFDVYDIVSRLMIRMMPPYRTIRFDDNGRTLDQFEALIIGFGKSGQSALRSLVMNGQFAGSDFHATVVAKDISQQKGTFLSRYKGIIDNYHIDFLEMDARSEKCYELIETRGKRLKYLALCTGSEEMNKELATEYMLEFKNNHLNIPVIQCSLSGVRKDADDFGEAAYKQIYSADILCNGSLDSMAMIINHQYHINEGNSAEEDWRRCDYFSKMSCRASADYCDAMLAAAGSNRNEVAEKGFAISNEMLETLSDTEHKRWCAFHYAMGYRKMPDEVWEKRAEAYKKEKESNGSSNIRIGKDTITKKHACLIPWEKLDELSVRESQITGIRKDYKQYDRDNVIMITDMLRLTNKE